MPAVGIDISSGTIRFIELERTHGRFRVGRFGAAEIPSGVMQGGSIHDPTAISSILSTMAKKQHLSLAHVTLPEEQAFLAHIEFPRVPLSGVRDAIELHLEDSVPVPPDEAAFDYIVTSAPGDETMSAIVGVLPKQIVEQYLEIFRGTGIIPKSLELQSFAMARALFPRDDHRTSMGIDIGKDMTNVFIVSDNVVHFSAILDIGGGTLTQALMRKLGVTEQEADALKIKHGLVGGRGGVPVRDAMLPILEDLRERIMHHFAFWQTRHGASATVERVVLTGGGSNLKGIAEYLGQGVRATMTLANPWANVCDFDSYIPPIPMHVAQGYTAAIGLALRDGFGEE